MDLKISGAMASFELADQVELDCGTFDVIITQLAGHNAKLKAEIAKMNLANKKAKIATKGDTLTGSEQGDQLFIAKHLIKGWGSRPLIDDEGEEIKYSPEVMLYVFTETGRAGEILYSKLVQAVSDESLFTITDTDRKNS